jgi:hypothetical protein
MGGFAVRELDDDEVAAEAALDDIDRPAVGEDHHQRQMQGHRELLQVQERYLQASRRSASR